MIWCVVWVVLMLFWAFFGCYTYEPARPYMIGCTLIPWLCVLIIGLILFGAVTPGPVRF